MSYHHRLGAVGALLDEYERALNELIQVIASLSDAALTCTLDPHTADVNCRSIQSILTHVVSCGYGYATSIHNRNGKTLVRPAAVAYDSIAAYQMALANMFAFTEGIFRDIQDNDLEQLDQARKFQSSWGQYYDVEQLMEHAIVHILRHRRQIEKLTALLKV